MKDHPERVDFVVGSDRADEGREAGERLFAYAKLLERWRAESAQSQVLIQ